MWSEFTNGGHTEESSILLGSEMRARAMRVTHGERGVGAQTLCVKLKVYDKSDTKIKEKGD